MGMGENTVRSLAWAAGRRAVAWSVALLLAAGVAVAPGRGASGGARKPATRSSAKKQQAQQRLNRIRQEIHHKREALQKTKRQQRKVSEEIHENLEGLESARQTLRVVRTRLSSAEEKLRDAQQRLAESQRRLAGHVKVLRGRLVEIYKRGDVGYATALLHSRDMWDLTSRGYLLQRVVKRDTDLLASIRIEKARIAAETTRYRAQCDQVAQLRVAVEGQVQLVGDRLVEQRELQDELGRDRVRLEAALAELEQNSREVEQMLRAFEAQPDIARKIPHPWVGSFARPVPGRVTSGFGMRYHPILKVTKLHTGIDLAASSGTPIVAAGDGVVVSAGWWGGYGNCIVIAHGNGRSTLYGHCSSISVSRGQKVSRGQVVGRVGSTGFSTGPHCHFEVRVNGRPVNPLSH